MENYLAVDPAPAAATAIIAHVAAVVPVIVLGLYYFWREDLSVRALREAAAAGKAGGDDEPQEKAPAAGSEEATT